MPEERPGNDEICPECGKPRRSRAGLSVTQWIFNTQLCSCERDARRQSAMKLCPACGKPIRSGSGSITQWIFHQSACSCEGADQSALRYRRDNDSSRRNAQSNNADLSRRRNVSSRRTADKKSNDGMTRNESTDAEIDQELHLDAQRFPTDRYQPLAELGRGASGIVYLCRDKLLSKKVAIKSLHHVTPEAVISFQEEARRTSKLRHPNIIAILDFGVSAAGYPYLVMEYFSSTTLLQRYRQDEELTVQQCIQIGCALSKALAYAHQHQILHRDIKPSNVLLEDSADFEENNIRLIDFGIAKISEADSIENQSSTIAGTALYMAPDTIRHKSYDVRSDIYSLGCVLFEALEKRPPFPGIESLEIMKRHVEEPVPQTVRPAPIELKELVKSMLEKEKENRPQTMLEVNEILESLLQEDLKSTGSEPDSVAARDAEQSIQSKSVNSSAWMLALVIVTGVFISLLWNPIQHRSVWQSPTLSPDQSPRETNVRSFNTVTEAAIEEFKKRKATALDIKSIFPLNANKLFLFNDDLKAFRGYTLLKSVVLLNFDIDDSGMEYLTDSPIERLILRNSKVRTLSWAPKLSHLQFLDVSHTEVDDDSLENLPPSLLDLNVASTRAQTNVWFSRVKYLKRLDISRTKVSEQGLGGIANLKMLRHLLLLDSATDMTELRKLTQTSSVTRVDVAGCANLNKAEVRKFAIEEMPYCDFSPHYSSQLLESFKVASNEIDPPRTLQTYGKLKAILQQFDKLNCRTILKAECVLKIARCCYILKRWEEATRWLSRGRQLSEEYGNYELIARCKSLEASILEATDPTQNARIEQLTRESLAINEQILPADSKVLNELRTYVRKKYGKQPIQLITPAPGDTRL